MSRSTDIVLFMSYLSDPFFICSLLLYFFNVSLVLLIKDLVIKKAGHHKIVYYTIKIQ